MLPAKVGAPTLGRIVEGEPQAEFARRGDCRRTAECRGQLRRHAVGTPMAAQQRDHMAAIFSQGDNRWLTLLIAKMWRETANNDASPKRR